MKFLKWKQIGLKKQMRFPPQKRQQRPCRWMQSARASACQCCKRKTTRATVSTPNLVHIYFIVASLHALIPKSKGRRSKSKSYSYEKNITEGWLLEWPAPAAVDVGLNVIMTASFYFITARCNIYISRLCYDVSVRLSVRLSVTEVN